MPELIHAPVAAVRRVLDAGLPPHQETALFATLARLNTLYMIARAGSGHIGSSFSSAEIMAWLYLHELRGVRVGAGGPAHDVFFSSKGHDVPGMYAVMIGLGLLPEDKLHGLRRLGGLPGHPDVETPGIATNTGPLGMGISKAKGLVRANRLAGRDGRVVVLTGDGELQEGQIWESLAGAARAGYGEITVIVDHNKIQSDTWVSETSDLGDLEAKFAAFGWRTARIDGHDLAALERALADAKESPGQPTAIVADTIKGRGVSFMEHTALVAPHRFYRFHSGAPDDESYARAAAELLARANVQLAEAGLPALEPVRGERPARASVAGTQRMVAAYSRALLRHAEADARIVALDADLVLDTGLIPFQERFPERFVECGIAEQDMVSQAGALALAGLTPVVHSFACFLSTRPNEQIYNNATERTRVVYVGSLAGLLPGGPGHSHQSVRDIAALAGTPGLEMLEPSCEAEVEQAVRYVLDEAPGSSYLRLVSIPCRVPYTLPADYVLTRGRGATLVEGDDAVLFGYGPVLLPEAVAAAERLRAQGIALRVVNLPWLDRVDHAWLAGAVAGARAIFTLDNHYVAGGQGEMLGAALAEAGLLGGRTFVRFGVREIPACGQNDEVLRAHALDAASLATAITAALADAPADLATAAAR